MPKITQLLVCDNTLVLSQELAFEACAEVTNQILAKHGIDTTYNGPQLMADYLGSNFRDMMKAVEEKYGFKLSDEEFDEFNAQKVERVFEALEANGQPCVGSVAELKKLSSTEEYGLAVVTSSAKPLVLASIKKTKQAQFFPADHIFSAASSLPRPASKPAPAIYLHAAQVVGKEPEECVAIEESKSGVLSAVRAGMHVIGYVGSTPGKENQEALAAALKEKGAKVIMEDWSDLEKCLTLIEEA